MAAVAPGSAIDYNNQPAVNFSFGGSVMTMNSKGHKDEPKGFLMDAYGMFTCGRVLAALGMPFCATPNIQYGYGTNSDGTSLQAYEIRQMGMCCCARYDLFKHGQGMVPEGKFLARTNHKPTSGCCAKTIVTYALERDTPDGKERLYSLKNKPRTCMDCYAMWAPCSHCSKGVLEGNVCVNMRTPIFRGQRKGNDGVVDLDSTEPIGMLTKTSILYPTGCCTAAVGPAVNFRADLNPDVEAGLDDDDKAILALFIATAKTDPINPSGAALPIFGGSFCLGETALAALGWSLNIQTQNTSYDYMSLMDAFAKGAAETGDMVARAKSLATGK
jgi:hypothetical protein